MFDIPIIQFVALIPLAVLFGIFGCMSSWDKSSFFGHVLSHSMLLPLSFSVAMHITNSYWPMLISIIFAVIFAVVCIYMPQTTKYYSNDTILLVISFICLAASMLMTNSDVDVMLYIAGDMLLIDSYDVITLYILAIIVISYTFYNWKILIIRICNHDVAFAINKRSNRIAMIFLIMQATFIAVSIKMIGILLASATIIMPAVITRIFSSRAHRMMFLSILCGLFVMCCGCAISFAIDTQIAPMIVILYGILWILCYLFRRIYDSLSSTN